MLDSKKIETIREKIVEFENYSSKIMEDLLEKKNSRAISI